MEEPKEPVPGYRILDNIGEGGFARVYLAEQIALERNVALKVMSPKLSDDIEYCERFVREGKTLARLSSHADIVTIYDIGKADRFYFMAMEYLDGSDLKSRIGLSGYDGDAIATIKTIANALAYAHQAGVIHRDIKPANVLFDRLDKAVLSDFGIAKTLQGTDNTLTEVGTQMGTPSYMSPEQCRGEAQIDGRSDLYSLGVMFFEMLTGRKPFDGVNYLAIIAAHLNEPVPALPENSALYQPLLSRLMAKETSNRYASAEDFLTDLDKLTAKPSGSPRRMVMAGSVGVVMTAGLFFGWALYNKPKDEVPLTAVPSYGLLANDHDKVQRLLDSAQMHEIVGRFVAPPGSNALDAYRVVLDIDPANQFATSAVDRLLQEHGEQ